MRYASDRRRGLLGSHLAEALVAGHDVVGIDCFTDYYDPALKEENARASPRSAATCCGSTSPRSARPRGFDGVFHLAAHPACELGDVFRSTCEGTCSPRSAVRGRRTRRREGRLRLVVVGVRRAGALPDARKDTPPRPVSPYGITKLAGEHLADAYSLAFGLPLVPLRYFNAFGPRQRPDMAFTRIALALAAGTGFELFGDGDQSRGWTASRTWSTRRSPRWSAAPAPTTSAARSRRRDRTGAGCSSRSPGGSST
jgi:nucleoside-diphosphate-sugar epimerase